MVVATHYGPEDVPEMLTQAALTLRMHNTAFEDEALYLYVGHLEISHWLHGTALQGDYPSYFSGAPVLYRCSALFDSICGLTAARALTLAEMLAATGLLYTMARRLFNERVALCAAITFAVAELPLFLAPGHLQRHYAVPARRRRLAGGADRGVPPAGVPARRSGRRARGRRQVRVTAPRAQHRRARLAAVQKPWRKALIAQLALGVTTAGLLAGVLYLAGSGYLTGIKFTMLNRF